MHFSFEFIYKSTENQARLGRMHTSHGSIDTPVFMPVGTLATVKSLTPEELNELGPIIYICVPDTIRLQPSVACISLCTGADPS
jgi:queuine tRNA-ribosyltransferase